MGKQISPCCGDVLVPRSWPSLALGRPMVFCGCGKTYPQSTLGQQQSEKRPDRGNR